MDTREIWKELRQGEWEYLKTKAKYKIFHNYLPTIQISSSLPTLLICSSARSGSTWLMELLLKTARYRALFEAVPNAERSLREFSTPRFILSRAHPQDERTCFIHSILTRERRGWSQDHRNSRNIHWLAQGLLLKSTRANFCVDFLQSSLDIQSPGVLYLIRNPFDVVRSKIQKKAAAGEQYVDKFSYDPSLLFNTRDPFFLDYFNTFRHVLAQVKTDEGKEAFVWCLENKWMLDTWESRGWSLVIYENLVADFEAEFKALLNAVGLPFKRNVLTSSQVRSSTAYSGKGRELVSSKEFGNIEEGLNRWRQYYSTEKLDDICKVMEGFGIDYNLILGKQARTAVSYPS